MESQFILKITETIPKCEMWPCDVDLKDNGLVAGMYRGYCIEYKENNGSTSWDRPMWITGEPEEIFNLPDHLRYREVNNYTPTGRVAFYGYCPEDDAWTPDEEGNYNFDPYHCDENGVAFYTKKGA